jgi:hypothetical protein
MGFDRVPRWDRWWVRRRGVGGGGSAGGGGGGGKRGGKVKKGKTVSLTAVGGSGVGGIDDLVDPGRSSRSAWGA